MLSDGKIRFLFEFEKEGISYQVWSIFIYHFRLQR